MKTGIFRAFLAIFCGKCIFLALRLRGHSGTSLPGLIAEKIYPDILSYFFKRIRRGIIVISGTNGKTTTSHIVSDILTYNGFKVFSNDSGANYSRGILSSLIKKKKLFQKFNYDFAVLEIDEAHGIDVSQKIKPQYGLFLNISRDQMDRFLELEKTADCLYKIAQNITKKLILNKNDLYLMSFSDKINIEKAFFGYNRLLKNKFYFERSILRPLSSSAGSYVELIDINSNNYIYLIDGEKYIIPPVLKGSYNALNIAAAFSLCKEFISPRKCIEAAEHLSYAYGRNETFEIYGKKISLVLAKNPAGFASALELAQDRDCQAKGVKVVSKSVLFLLNDNYADSKDISWIWDVDFSALGGLEIYIGGSRAYDMALRLRYDELDVKWAKENIAKAIATLIQEESYQILIYSTYTAMIEARKILLKLSRKYASGQQKSISKTFMRQGRKDV